MEEVKPPLYYDRADVRLSEFTEQGARLQAEYKRTGASRRYEAGRDYIVVAAPNHILLPDLPA